MGRLLLLFPFLLLAACGAPALAPSETGTPASPTTSSLRHGFQIDYGNDYQRALKLTREAGFRWAKLQVRWADYEPTRGKTDFAYLDQVVDGAQAQQLKLLFSVTVAPQWARPPGSDLSVDGPPADPKTYASFVETLAKRYKGKVGAYEIWNEQNLSREWGGPGKVNAGEYVALLKAAHGAIKGADKDALVISGAPTPSGEVAIPEMGGHLASDDVEYFRQMYQAGMKGYFDGVGVHPSGFNNAPELDPKDPNVLNRPGGFHNHRSFYFRNFEAYRGVMVEQGDQSKQLWFTEFGWASGGQAGQEWAYAHETSEQQQADHLVKAFQIGKERGYVGAMFVWNLNFFGTDYAKRAFAVLNPDWTPRPAYKALSSMAK